MTLDNLSRKAVIRYGYIQECGGGALDEWQMRDKTGLSHGSICAARKELVNAGLLTLGKDGRRTTYILTSQAEKSTGTQAESDRMTEPAHSRSGTPRGSCRTQGRDGTRGSSAAARRQGRTDKACGTSSGAGRNAKGGGRVQQL